MTGRLYINPPNTKRRPLYLKPSFYRAVNTFHLGYKNQSVYAVSGTSRCLFSDKYKTHKYGVGRTYSCWMLNWWCITWPVGFKWLRYETVNFARYLIKCHSLTLPRYAGISRFWWRYPFLHNLMPAVRSHFPPAPNSHKSLNPLPNPPATRIKFASTSSGAHKNFNWAPNRRQN